MKIGLNRFTRTYMEKAGQDDQLLTGSNEFGGDASWSDEPLPSDDRGDTYNEQVDDSEGRDHSSDTGADNQEYSDNGSTVGSESDSETVSEDGRQVEESQLADGREASGESDSDAGEAQASTENSGERQAPTGYIPRSRLNQAVNQRRQAEQRANDLQAKLNATQENLHKVVESVNGATPSVDINSEAFEKIQQAILSGDDGMAMNLMKEAVTVGKPELPELPSAEQQPQTPQYTPEQQEVINTASAISQEYPEFDKNNDGFDESLTAEVNQLAMVFNERGNTASESIRKAANLVAQREGLVNREVEASAEVMAMYPVLNASLENSNQELIREVIETKDAFVSKGLSATDSWRKAADIVAFENGIKPEVVSRVEPKAEATRFALPGTPDAKPKANVARNEKGQFIKDSAKPSSKANDGGKLKGSSNKASEVDVSRMSSKQFREMSEEQKAKARGDFG